MSQRFYAAERDTLVCNNGAIGHRTGSAFDCLGPFAKVRNCPVVIDGKEVARLTCYATGYADTYFSVPACTRKKRRYVKGYFTMTDAGIEFRVMDMSKHVFQ